MRQLNANGRCVQCRQQIPPGKSGRRCRVCREKIETLRGILHGPFPEHPSPHEGFCDFGTGLPVPLTAEVTCDGQRVYSRQELFRWLHLRHEVKAIAAVKDGAVVSVEFQSYINPVAALMSRQGLITR
jgi:hypothetical protein